MFWGKNKLDNYSFSTIVCIFSANNGYDVNVNWIAHLCIGAGVSKATSMRVIKRCVKIVLGCE